MKKIMVLLLLASFGLHAQADKVKFAAVIKNPNSDSLVIRSRTFKQVLKAKKPGNFAGTFAAETGFYQIFDGTEQTSVYLKNGFDLTASIDAKQFDETLAFKGKGEKENNFLAKLAIDMERLSESIATAAPEEQNKAITAKLDELAALLKDPAMDENFRTGMQQELQGQKQQLVMMAQQAAAAKALQGKPSALFAYENYKGGTTKLEELKGKYVYIDVWATWCGPCRGEIPHLQKIEEKYHGKKIEFVSISIDQAKDHDKWKKFVGDKTLGGTQLFADADWKSAFIQSYGINSIPRFILLDPQGNVVDADAKRPSDPELQTQLDALLK